MDILASILAYLTCVAAIVGALGISVMVCFSTPGQPGPPHNVAVAASPGAAKSSATKIGTANLGATKTGTTKTTATKTAAVQQAMPAGAAPRDARPATLPQTAAAGTKIVQSGAVTNARQRTHLSPAQLRHLAQEERAKHWAYQQDPDFESRFMSYAD